jgi:hypothetical protein
MVRTAESGSSTRQRAETILDFRPVCWSRDALILIFGYAAVIWGSAGLRQ